MSPSEARSSGGAGDRARALQRVGLYHEAIAQLREELRARPDDLGLVRQLLSLYKNADDREAMLELLGGMPAPDSDARWLKARLLADLGRKPEALRAIQEAVRAAPGLEGLVRAAWLLVAVGEYDLAKRRFLAASRLAPDDVRPILGLATLRLWSVDLRRAVRLVQGISSTDTAPPAVQRIVGAAALLRGDWQGADASLASAIEGDAHDPETFVWRSELRRRLGRHAEAERDAQHARSLSGAYHLAAELNEQLARLAAHPGRPDQPLRREAYADLFMKLAGLLPASIRAKKQTARSLATACERALVALGGNRSAEPTRLVSREGKVALRRIELAEDPRFAARAVQMLIRSRSSAEVLERLVALERRHPAAATVACHTGEVLLWLGRYEEARAAFERALKTNAITRWAYIGLAAVRLLEGDFRGSISECERGTRLCPPPPGRTMFTYRGEAHRALGRLSEALADFEEALRLDPRRLSARINLAITKALLRKRPDDRDAVAAVRDLPPGLASEAIAAARSKDPVAVLSMSLELMRGNRSTSLVTYFDREGRIRFA